MGHRKQWLWMMKVIIIFRSFCSIIMAQLHSFFRAILHCISVAKISPWTWQRKFGHNTKQLTLVLTLQMNITWSRTGKRILVLTVRQSRDHRLLPVETAAIWTPATVKAAKVRETAGVQATTRVLTNRISPATRWHWGANIELLGCFRPYNLSQSSARPRLTVEAVQ